MSTFLLGIVQGLLKVRQFTRITIILPEAVSVDPGPLSAGPGISPRVAVVPPESSHSCPLSEYIPPRHCSRTSQGQTVY